ncbi:hypothetical protein C0992_003139 [Termitomyces sp. T32_za158]|nr:hypothetical protein C0992_003139 [Termitomyces sp. T32_za158]
MSSQYHLRPAEPKDVPVLLELIIGLADYEKARDSVQATPEIVDLWHVLVFFLSNIIQLHKNLFETPYAHALIAFSGPAGVAGGEAIGFAIYFFNFSTWTGKPGLYLEDLYVKPDHRAKGIGKAFFVELSKAAQAKASNVYPVVIVMS